MMLHLIKVEKKLSIEKSPFRILLSSELELDMDYMTIDFDSDNVRTKIIVSDPTNIKFPIPGNDDARRSINLYCDLLKNTILDAAKNIQAKEDKKEEKKKIEKKVDKKNKVKK